MTGFLFLSASMALADRLSLEVGVGPPQVKVAYYREVLPKIEGGLSLGGSGFEVNDCGLVYLDPNSTAGTFECSDLTIWAGQFNLEAIYSQQLPEYWEMQPIVAFGSYLGIGMHSNGIYERLGLIGELRMDWKPIDIGCRAIIGRHGLLKMVYGIGLSASIALPSNL